MLYFRRYILFCQLGTRPSILNFIADELITKPKELEVLYADLIPLKTQEHIKQRDKQK